jgi:hypothetical protein
LTASDAAAAAIANCVARTNEPAFRRRALRPKSHFCSCVSISCQSHVKRYLGSLNRRFRELRAAVPVERGEKWKHPPGAAAVCVAAVIIALLSFVSSETVLVVKRPAYPIKAEPPEGVHWLIIGTDDSNMLAHGVNN